MKKHLLRTVLLFIASIQLLYAQPPKYAQVLQYYKLVNNAEINICNNNLKQAAIDYASAYRLMGNRMSSKHLYNYFIVSADLQNWDVCKYVLLELRKRDWKYEWFYANMNEFFPAATAMKLIDMYNGLGDVKPVIDYKYMAILDSVIAVDQAVNKGFRAKNNGLLSDEGKDSLGKLNRQHIAYLNELFSKKFPTDNVLGGGSPLYGLYYTVLLVHNAQLGRSRKLDGILYDAVLRGDFAPEELDYRLSNYFEHDISDTVVVMGNNNVRVPLFPYQFIVEHDSLFQSPPHIASIERCERNRLKIPGLCSVEELRVKIIYQHFYPRYHFVSPDYILHVDMELPGIRKKYILVKDKP